MNTVRMLVAGLALLCSLIAAGAQAPAPVPADDLQRLLQIDPLLDHLAGKRELLTRVARTVSAGQVSDADALFAGVLLAEPMRAAARSELQTRWDAQRAAAALPMLAQAPWPEYRALEVAAAAPEQFAAVMAQSRLAEPPTSERRQLIRRLDERLQTSQWMAAFADTVAREVVLQMQLPENQRKFGKGQREVLAAALRQQAINYRESRPGEWVLYLAFRQLDNASLAAYLQRLEAAELQWALDASRQALIAGFTPGVARYAANLLALMPVIEPAPAPAP